MGSPPQDKPMSAQGNDFMSLNIAPPIVVGVADRIRAAERLRHTWVACVCLLFFSAIVSCASIVFGQEDQTSSVRQPQPLAVNDLLSARSLTFEPVSLSRDGRWLA